MCTIRVYGFNIFFIWKKFKNLANVNSEYYLIILKFKKIIRSIPYIIIQKMFDRIKITIINVIIFTRGDLYLIYIKNRTIFSPLVHCNDHTFFLHLFDDICYFDIRTV